MAVAIDVARVKGGGDHQVADPFPRKGLLKPWRQPVLERMRMRCMNDFIDCSTLDLYQFGVYSGRSMRGFARHFNNFAPAYTIPRTMWGFDSFEGLPADEAPRSNTTGKNVRPGVFYRFSEMLGANGSFAPSAFSLSGLLHTANRDVMMATLDAYVNSSRTTVGWVPGFFNVSLTRSLAAARGMRTALYVDIDVDIYVSTREALEWLCQQRLIARGSILGYDDWHWGWVHGKGKTYEHLDGQPRAHLEVLSRKYGLSFAKIGRAFSNGGAALEVTYVPWNTSLFRSERP